MRESLDLLDYLAACACASPNVPMKNLLEEGRKKENAQKRYGFIDVLV